MILEVDSLQGTVSGAGDKSLGHESGHGSSDHGGRGSRRQHQVATGTAHWRRLAAESLNEFDVRNRLGCPADRATEATARNIAVHRTTVRATEETRAIPRSFQQTAILSAVCQGHLTLAERACW